MTMKSTPENRALAAADVSTPRPATALPMWYSSVIGLLLVAVTTYGLLAADAYRVSPGVREDFRDVMRGQDV
jgi:hypothetical protein